ncbi:ABC transporter substrate-binding protein [Ruminococcaceae bacterium OttesenSCG-928-L11]|nr:ABC transporter substrate-binding protein [Ruminococcaceae bacterium OttesenSCG-928-L11]
MNKNRLHIWTSLLLALLLTVGMLALVACSPDDDKDTGDPTTEEPSEVEEAPSEYPVTVEGVTVRSRPSRVISLSPALTEKLFDLGLEDALVGVSDNCDYPAAAEGLPRCGTVLLPKLDAIKDLKPHLVLTQTDLDEETLIALQQMDVDVVAIPTASSVAEWKKSYVSLARLLEGEYSGGDMGERFAQNIQDRLDYLEGYLVPYAQENGVKPALYLRLLDFNVATGDTLENELMAVIGLDNIASEQTGWLFPEEEANGSGRAAFESVRVMYMDEAFVTIKDLERSTYYKGLQATLKDWYLYIDSIVFERQSLRMLDTLADMAAYAYPDAVPQTAHVADAGEIEWADEDGESEDDAA